MEISNESATTTNGRRIVVSLSVGTRKAISAKPLPITIKTTARICIRHFYNHIIANFASQLRAFFGRENITHDRENDVKLNHAN
jgi:hypothetical protein